MRRASARRSADSLPPFFTRRSPGAEGTIAQVDGPAFTVIARVAELTVTVCFLPASVHTPFAWETSTSGAPHSARGNGSAAKAVRANARRKRTDFIFMSF